MRLSYLFSPGIVTAVLAMGGGSFATVEGKYNGDFFWKTSDQLLLGYCFGKKRNYIFKLEYEFPERSTSAWNAKVKKGRTKERRVKKSERRKEIRVIWIKREWRKILKEGENMEWIREMECEKEEMERDRQKQVGGGSTERGNEWK